MVVIIAVAAPLGLANGRRAFLLSYVLAYFSSLILSRAFSTGRLLLLSGREILTLGVLLAILLLIFAVMGFVRGGYGAELDIAYTILIWPVSTLSAMDSWVTAALSSKSTYGVNFFGWLASALSRLGVIDVTEATKVMQGVNDYFLYTHNSALVIPRSILPDLIFDFGPSGVFIGIAVVVFCLEFVVTRCAARGYLMHVVAVQALLASFMTIQHSGVTPGTAATVFWGAVLAIAMKRGWMQRR